MTKTAIRRLLFGLNPTGTPGTLVRRWSSLPIHNQLNDLVTNGNDRTIGFMRGIANGNDWRVTVVIAVRTDTGLGRKGLYPGHAAISIWRHALPAPDYYAVEIYDDGTFADSGDVDIKYNPGRASGTANTWYFTKPISRIQAEKMLVRSAEITGTRKRYSEFFGNRYAGKYSCHTVVDDILSYGDLSSTIARPWSWGTVWLYSSTFTVTGWHSSVMYNTKNY